jgi:hypothetical protein
MTERNDRAARDLGGRAGRSPRARPGCLCATKVKEDL